MLPEYNPETKTLTIDNESFTVESRRRVRGYEYFALEDGRKIISNGDIFLYTPTSSYGARQLQLYENRPPISEHLLPITEDTLINSLEEGLEIYLGITGACEGGTNIFLSTLKCPPFPVSIKLLVLLTRNKYGSDILKEHIWPTGKRLFFGSQNKEGLIIPHPSQITMSKKERIAEEIRIASIPTAQKED